MEANIVMSGVPRCPDSQDNARCISKIVKTFRRKYPGAIIENPIVEPVGKRSQTITFAVKASDLTSVQAMQTYFERQLVQRGFSPTDDAQAATENLLGRMADGSGLEYHVKDASGLRKRAWWKFW